MKKRMALFGLVVVLVLPGVAQTMEEPKEKEVLQTLETVLVTGTRMEQNVESVPANVTVIDREDIKQSNAKNVPDLLRAQEGIVVRDLLGNGKSAQVDLRGFGETGPFNTLVLVDGRRINEVDLSGVDWTQIPLDQIERVEIVRGTGTVLYGDNASGGVINIITKTPAQVLRVQFGETLGSYERHKEGLSLNGGSQRVAASIFASRDRTNGYRENNEFETKDVGGKIVFDPTESLSLTLNASYHADEYGQPGAIPETLLASDRRAARFPFDDAESTDKYMKLDVDMDLGTPGRLSADVSFRDRESESTFVEFISGEKRETQTWGFTPRYVWSGAISNHSNTLIAGIDLYRAEQDLKTFFAFTPPPALSGTSNTDRDSSGFYVHNEFSLLENLLFSVGARRERVKYDLSQQDLAFGLAPLDDKLTERESAYTAGLVFLYNRNSSVFVRANRSFRFPLVDELIVFDFMNGRINVNSELSAQVGRHYEVGFRHHFNKALQANLTLYHAKFEDEIFFNTANFANENHPETRHRGIEVGGKADLLRWVTVLGNYTYAKATFEKDPFKDNDIPAVPKRKAHVGLRIHDILPGLVLSSDYNYVGSSFAISDQVNGFNKLGRYATIDARVSYAWNRLEAFFGVNNITDKKYAEYAVIGGSPRGLNFHPAPERNVVGGLTITF